MDANAFGTILVIVTALVALAVIGLALYSLVWVYTDSRARSKSALVWLLVAFYTWPFGVLVYYLTRKQEVKL
jgi:hypothetical protein